MSPQRKPKGTVIPKPELRRMRVVQGWSVNKIASHFRMAPVMVERLLRKHGFWDGVDLEPHKEEIFDLFLNHGWLKRELAEKFGCKMTEITTLMQKHGVVKYPQNKKNGKI